MMEINDKKLTCITSLVGPKRYSHFIKVVADQRRAWGLFKDGWAMVEGGYGNLAFPLWPARPYAVQCAVREWVGYEAREIDMDTLIGELLPRLRATSTGVAIFPTPTGKGVFPELDVFEADIYRELARIE